MARFKERVNCTNPDCGQLNQVEIILSTNQGGAAGRYGLPENGARMKIVVVPGDG
jgi:hypothetical protein